MVSFKMFAGTDVGLRENNEDNFTVCPDLAKNEWIVPADCQQAIPLGEKGCLMVVADGMGGQNAGEVASAIAIATVQERFSPANMPADIMDNPNTIKAFLKKVISEADNRIKRETENNPSTYGMGSTIVIAWLTGCKLYVAWLGDSRAYSFVHDKGIGRLSKDHSYVQQLVDAGTITDAEAMYHPNSNVITRSLGDTSQKAKADVIEHDIVDGEIILLCSDGLCGVCRDEETGDIIDSERDNLMKCTDRLITTSLNAGGSDNITIAILQVLHDGKIPAPREAHKKGKGIPKKVLAPLALICLLLLSVLFLNRKEKNDIPIKESIRLELASDSITYGKGISYKVHVKGSRLYHIEYDKSLLKVDSKKQTISLTKDISKDTVVWIKAVSNSDKSKRDSVKLTLIATKESEIFIIPLRENREQDIPKEEIKQQLENKEKGSNLNKSIQPGQDDANPIKK